MGKLIPFFYHDLLARIVPGAVFIGFLALTDVRIPTVWSRWLSDDGFAQKVLSPLIYSGAAYLIGLIYEAFLNPLFDAWFVGDVFTRAVRTTALLDKPTQLPNGNEGDSDPTQLARRCISVFHEIATRDRSPEFEHVTRFHAEGKMFFFLACVLSSFALGDVVSRILSLIFVCQPPVCIPDSYAFRIIVALAILVSVHAATQRFERRCLQIVRFIVLRSETAYEPRLEELRRQILRYSASLKGTKPVSGDDVGSQCSDETVAR
jgi:hypothetical protein